MGYSELDDEVTRGNRKHYFYAGHVTAFDDATTPGSRLYSGTSTDIEIDSISAPGAVMTFALQPVPTETNTLTVVSVYGMSDPTTGVHEYVEGTTLTVSITNTVSVVESTRSELWATTGWVGTGSAPAFGSGTTTGPFGLDTNSTVTWSWAVSNLWVSNQTVTATVTEDALGTITAGDGYAVDPAGDVTLEAGARVRLTPGFHAETGSTVRISISQP